MLHVLWRLARVQVVLALADLGRRIEQHFGAAQDIEWAIDRALSFPDNLVVLQSRPETAGHRRQAAARCHDTPAPGAAQHMLSAVLRAMAAGRRAP